MMKELREEGRKEGKGKRRKARKEENVYHLPAACASPNTQQIREGSRRLHFSET